MRTKPVRFCDACEGVVAFDGGDKRIKHTGIEGKCIIEMEMQFCGYYLSYEAGCGAVFVSRIPGYPIGVVCVVARVGCMGAKYCDIGAKGWVEWAWWDVDGGAVIVVRGDGGRWRQM